MATDEWGIDDGYEDAAGKWQDVSRETIAAVRAAMGDDVPESHAQRDVKVVRRSKAEEGTGHRAQGSNVAPPNEPFCASGGTLTLEDGSSIAVRDSKLPPDLPFGYHDFRPDDETEPTVRLIVTPGECPIPPGGLWGWSGQLYAARSQQSWGFGDLADLRRLGRWTKSNGGSVVLVNPLSAASPVTPQQPSPYYPSSRRFLNPLYLRIEEIPGAADVVDDLTRLQTMGRALNGQRTIDRDAVFRLKMEALDKIWQNQSPGPSFEEFCSQHGRELNDFASYCVLAEQFGGDWHRWPAEFQAAASAAVGRFVDANRDRFHFHRWLQWLLDEQLRHAAEDVQLVQDVAIGIDPAGADAWCWQPLLAHECSIGAPPDLYNPLGQDWGLPPFVPHKLRATGYEPFIQTLRAILRHAGGLRIDHVMGLFRLYWIPRGFGPARGAFVRYRTDELLAIIAIESQRVGAFVVGEDLGTVEEGVRETLADSRLLSYRLLWFEDETPACYPELSMASISTHDLPTIAGLWSGDDLAAQRSLGLKPNAEAINRIREKLAHMAQLDDEARVEDVIAQAYWLLSRAASSVATVSLDDALAVTERPNMPSTTDEWPNWSLGLPGGIEALEAAPLAARISAVMRKRAGA